MDFSISLNVIVVLKRPEKDCSFAEYRNWIIVNFLLNSGCRAATIRNIQNKDVDFDAMRVIFRHNKNGKIQVIPLCSLMGNLLKNYMKVRKGKPEDYLFCDIYGGMLTENALRLAIAHYNKSRGVKSTSIHKFRHTFARKYLVDCGGNAFTLQKLLGHSTLNMTKHYCRIFDSDISKDYDMFGKEICEPLFGSVNLFASSGGLPLWANLLLALADEIRSVMQGELAAREQRIAKYVEKYRK